MRPLYYRPVPPHLRIALAAAAQRPDKFEIAYVEEEELAARGLTGRSTPGSTPVSSVRDLHVDIEAFEGSYLHSVWVASLRLKDVSLFLNTLKERNPNAILTWGFHLDDLQIAADLKRAGVRLWWFEADEARARERFAARGDSPIDVFDAQIKRIKNNRGKIEELFQSNIVKTLRPNNSRMTFREIYETLRNGR